MKKIIIIITIALLPFVAFGQQTNVVRFEKGTWEQLQERAKREHKYIFLDVMATWCGPCKEMDSQVYGLSAVAEFMNANFLSFKLQIDSTRSDNAATRQRYGNALTLRKQFSISSLPTFLYFSPAGDLVAQGGGLMTAADFIGLGKQALDPQKLVYYKQLAAYRSGEKNFAVMASLALNAQTYHQDALAKEIALDYKQHYLDQADEQTLGKKENLDLVTKIPDMISGSADPYFHLFLSQPAIADSAYHYPGLSKAYVNWFIQKEEIDDRFIKDGKAVVAEPDWAVIFNRVKKKYGDEYAKNDVSLAARISFYRRTGQWLKWGNAITKALKTYPVKPFGSEFGVKTGLASIDPNDDWTLNTIAWDAFQHCADKAVLRMAAQWSDLSIVVNPELAKDGPNVEYLDTKANILFKMGKTAEAIKTEEKAYNMLKEKAVKEHHAIGGEDIAANLNKMKTGRKTW